MTPVRFTPPRVTITPKRDSPYERMSMKTLDNLLTGAKFITALAVILILI